MKTNQMQQIRNRIAESSHATDEEKKACKHWNARRLLDFELKLDEIGRRGAKKMRDSTELQTFQIFRAPAGAVISPLEWEEVATVKAPSLEKAVACYLGGTVDILKVGERRFRRGCVEYIFSSPESSAATGPYRRRRAST